MPVKVIPAVDDRLQKSGLPQPSVTSPDEIFRVYQEEGSEHGGSDLSSLPSSSFHSLTEVLQAAGLPFKPLADLYCGESDDDDWDLKRGRGRNGIDSSSSSSRSHSRHEDLGDV